MTEKNSLSGWSHIITEQNKKFKEKTAPDNSLLISDNRFEADWNHIWTKEEAERELAPFKFNGPGWYLTKSIKNVGIDTLLVIPDSIPHKEGEDVLNDQLYVQLKDIFAHTWPEGTKFRFYCYNSRNPAALFCAIATAPTRLDER